MDDSYNSLKHTSFFPIALVIVCSVFIYLTPIPFTSFTELS